MSRKYMNDYIKMQQSTNKKLTKKIRDEIDYFTELYRAQKTQSLSMCESPIEQLFHLHFQDAVNDIRNELHLLSSNSILSYCSQEEVLVNGNRYRLDFSLICTINGNIHKFAIECDGHDFHEKTKEQASRDKKRERNLISDGYVVIRFTGSEIWNKTSECSREADEIVRKAIGLNDYWESLVEKDLGRRSNHE